MPTTTEKGYIINVRQTGGTSAQSNIIFRNRRTFERLMKNTVSNEVNTNLNDTKEWPSGYDDADGIDIVGTGLKSGSATHTVNRARGGGRVVLTMVDVTTTNAPAVTIG